MRSAETEVVQWHEHPVAAPEIGKFLLKTAVVSYGKPLFLQLVGSVTPFVRKYPSQILLRLHSELGVALSLCTSVHRHSQNVTVIRKPLYGQMAPVADHQPC